MIHFRKVKKKNSGQTLEREKNITRDLKELKITLEKVKELQNELERERKRNLLYTAVKRKHECQSKVSLLSIIDFKGNFNNYINYRD